MGRRLRDAAEARGAATAPAAQDRPSRDPRLPRERARPRRRSSGWTTPKRRAGSRRRSSSMRRNAPAHLNLGDVRCQQGDVAGADCASGSGWSSSRPSAPTSRSRGSRAPTRRLGDGQRFPALCRRLIAANPQDWRARLALARHLASQGQLARGARAAVRGARPATRTRCAAPGDLADAVAAAPAAGAGRVATSSSRATPSSTSIPHICVRCRYRSTELLWQCPHCHEWNTFVEERIAPAKDTRGDA